MYLPSWVSCLWTDTVSVLCLKPSGQTMLGHELLSLSAFNSQLTALIATAPCSLLNPGAIPPPESDYNSLYWDTAVQLPPTDETGWAARSVSAEAKCSFSQHVSCWPTSACVYSLSSNMDTVSDRYCLETLTKTLVMSREILRIAHLWILKHVQAAKLHIVMQGSLPGISTRAHTIIIQVDAFKLRYFYLCAIAKR